MNIFKPESLSIDHRVLQADRDPALGALRFQPNMADRQCCSDGGVLCEDRIIGDSELIYYVGGRGEAIISGKRYQARPGLVLAIRPYELHTILSDAQDPHDNYWVHFNIEPPALAEGVLRSVFPDEKRAADIGVQPFLISLYQSLIDVVKEKQSGYAETAGALCTALFLQVWRRVTGTIVLPKLAPEETLLSRIEEYTRRHMDERLDAERLCAEFNLGRTRLFELFRLNRGISPAAWIRRERLRSAELLLKTGNLPLKDVADRLGFSDAFHLSRSFKEVYGASPRSWMERLRY
jgi:AraC-like DNA-binding protein